MMHETMGVKQNKVFAAESDQTKVTPMQKLWFVRMLGRNEKALGCEAHRRRRPCRS
jgi:hypothetical protein